MRVHQALIRRLVKKANDTYHNYTSSQYILRLAWPIIISTPNVPLVRAFDVAMMGRIDDPALIGGVGLGMMLFNAIYFGILLLLVVNLINRALDFLFVLGLGMAGTGVAIESVVAHWSSFLFISCYVSRPGSRISISRFLEPACFHQLFVTAFPNVVFWLGAGSFYLYRVVGFVLGHSTKTSGKAQRL